MSAFIQENQKIIALGLFAAFVYLATKREQFNSNNFPVGQITQPQNSDRCNYNTTMRREPDFVSEYFLRKPLAEQEILCKERGHCFGVNQIGLPYCFEQNN